MRARFAVAGDWHGNTQAARAAVRTLRDHGITNLLHVGDLAVRWPGPKKGRFDSRLEQQLADAGIRMLFIDGNHDNHLELRELPSQPDGTRRLSDHISYIPRGAVLDIGGLRVGGLGGAFSVDRQWRTEGKDLWADLEEPTEEEAARLIAAGPVDILLFHDAPACFRGLESKFNLPQAVAAHATRTRELLQGVLEAMRPKAVFSGHWHQRRTHTAQWPDGTSTQLHALADDSSWAGNLVEVRAHDSGAVEVLPLVVGSKPQRDPEEEAPYAQTLAQVPQVTLDRPSVEILDEMRQDRIGGLGAEDPHREE
ncbi:metallophosphoesterase [Sinomonas halotolerans]|uniref:Metallophosphoesterase n=1 Tax=Sinomonas halotolerans TaxID=1644133 RepID=A0ABU9WWC0_9MICC